MKKKELRRIIHELRADVRRLEGVAWNDLPEAKRQSIVDEALARRATRRAAQSPFHTLFEDELANAGVDIIRDINRSWF